MARTEPRTDAITRWETIQLLRAELLKLTDCETSICRAAADKGIFCNGFNRFGDGELRRRFAWLGDRARSMSREELEEIANRWQLARQEVDGLPIACDVQQREHDTCRGWDDFTNSDLARFYFQLTGVSVIVA
jgi:hypothetical protein